MRWPWRKPKEKQDAEHLRTGLWGENHAADFLKQNGYRLLGKRVRIGTRDELDLVARQDNVLVFIEVKTRKSEDFGRPASSVNRAKRHTLSRAAIRYMKKIKQRPEYFRFDVIEVIGSEGDGAPKIRHIKNAFNLDRIYRAPW